MDATNPTKQDVIDRLRPIYQQAVRERTGVSYFISEAETRVFSKEDRAKLEAETGYPAPPVHFIFSWPEETSTKSP